MASIDAAVRFFVLGMGVTTATRFGNLRRVGNYPFGFGMPMPIVSAAGGVRVGWILPTKQPPRQPKP